MSMSAETWGIGNHTQPTSPEGANMVNPTWQRGEQVGIQVRPLRGRTRKRDSIPHVCATLRHGANLIRPLRGRLPRNYGSTKKTS